MEVKGREKERVKVKGKWKYRSAFVSPTPTPTQRLPPFCRAKLVAKFSIENLDKRIEENVADSSRETRLPGPRALIHIQYISYI